MNNDIISFFDFNPDEVEILKVEVDEASMSKFIHVEKKTKIAFCPVCALRMHSKGIYKRTINHPILQDGYKLYIIFYQRRWKCINPQCTVKAVNDEASFVQKNHRNTHLVPYHILFDMKDINATAKNVAEKYNVSDTFVHMVILRYLDCSRLPLPEILSVDEVFINFDRRNTYALVLMDFSSGQIIDMLPNRLISSYDAYFKSISVEERSRVKVLVCDMYNPYINMTKRYFPNAICIVDSFHVIQYLNRGIAGYIRSVKNKFEERDKNRMEEINAHSNRQIKKTATSDEVYLLNKYSYFLLKNVDHIKYSDKKFFNQHFRSYMDTYDLESRFFEVDEKFREIRFYKEMYIEFNNNFPRNLDLVEADLNRLIILYKNLDSPIFTEFSRLLYKYRQEIINSFIYISSARSQEHGRNIIDTAEDYRRISNGPMEGFNRNPKDLKRNSRGVSDIEYTIKRIIWSNRKDEPVRAVPRDIKEIIDSHKTKK